MQIPGAGIKARTGRSSAPVLVNSFWKKSWAKPGTYRRSMLPVHRKYLSVTFHGPESKGWERKPGDGDRYVSWALTLIFKYYLQIKESEAQRHWANFLKVTKLANGKVRMCTPVFLTTSTQYTVFSKACNPPPDPQPFSSWVSWFEAVSMEEQT